VNYLLDLPELQQRRVVPSDAPVIAYSSRRRRAGACRCHALSCGKADALVSNRRQILWGICKAVQKLGRFVNVCWPIASLAAAQQCERPSASGVMDSGLRPRHSAAAEGGAGSSAVVSAPDSLGRYTLGRHGGRYATMPRAQSGHEKRPHRSCWALVGVQLRSTAYARSQAGEPRDCRRPPRTPANSPTSPQMPLLLPALAILHDWPPCIRSAEAGAAEIRAVTATVAAAMVS
jgi:hypothetical protein